MPTVSANYLKSYFETCVALGVSPARLLALIPGKANNLDDPTTRFSVSVLHDILKLARKVTNNPAIGLETRKYFRPGTHGAAGQGLMACPTLREGSKFLARYESLMQQYGNTHVVVDENYTWVEWTTFAADPEIDLILTDASIAHHVKYLRWLTQDNDMDIKLVHLRRQKPEFHARYQEAFGCSVAFNQQRDAIALDRGMIDFPLPQGNKKLLGGICNNLDGILKQIELPETATEKTLRSIENLMSKGTVDLPTVAADIGVSDRNLRRLLHEEGTSYRTLLQDVRRKTCENLMFAEKVPLTEISERLCYSEQSAFSRAFKTWYGQTPKAYAKAQLANAK